MDTRTLIRTQVRSPSAIYARFFLSCSTGIFFSKDRREEVIEVEEEAEILQVPGTTERVKIMTQGQWMKGCPEGSEQSFLFQLYSLLTDETPQSCPQGCGASWMRSKTDFFSFFVCVCTWNASVTGSYYSRLSLNLQRLSIMFEKLSGRSVHNANLFSVLPVENLSQQIEPIDPVLRQMITSYFTARIYKVLFLELVSR